MTGQCFEIGGKSIGPGCPPFLIAELSGNHNGSLERAIRLLRAAVEAGADAIKLQTYRPDTLTIDHDGPGFVIEKGPWAGRRLFELYAEASTPWEWHEALFAEGRRLGVPVFSTPFDPTAVDFLERLQAPAFKIASFEIVDLPLVRRIAETGRPLLMSTGMATDTEIREAVTTARAAGARDIVVLHCNSGYPTPVSDSRLATMAHLRALTGCPVGLSDHTLGTAVAVAAVALGAVAIEKHITLARADGGPDAAFSLEPDEFARLCRDCRDAFAAIGEARRGLSPSEEASRVFRRSLYAVAAIRAGEPFTETNVRSIRPGHGLPPKELPRLLGRRARRDIARGTPLSWELVEGESAVKDATGCALERETGRH